MGAIAPAWLADSFVQSMQAIGATATPDQLRVEAHDLIKQWNAPGRVYHNTRHLMDNLDVIDELADQSHDPDLLAVATWYHGALINRGNGSTKTDANPEYEAERISRTVDQRLRAMGVSDDVATRVTELVKYLGLHRAPENDVDAQVVVDADLSVLAAPPQEFKKFRMLLRQEFSDLDDLTYLRARRLMVRRLLSQPFVFSSLRGDEWNQQAHENLEMELWKITKAIHALDPHCPIAADDAADDRETAAQKSDPEFHTPVAGTAVVIQHRKLRKNASCTVADDVKSTGVLPDIQPDETAASDEPESSSLEIGI